MQCIDVQRTNECTITHLLNDVIKNEMFVQKITL